MGELLVAIIEADPGALSVCMKMLGAPMKLSAHLSAENRFKISETMRDAADTLERPKVQSVVIK